MIPKDTEMCTSSAHKNSRIKISKSDIKVNNVAIKITFLMKIIYYICFIYSN